MNTCPPSSTACAASNTASARHRAWEALAEKRFFKLICGGSFTDAGAVEVLAGLYARAGVDCIDIAPDPAVLSAVETAFSLLPPEIPRPLVMVSLPLDPDPHFRKIELIEPDCILCGACVPVCPTEAIAMVPERLDISQPLCYGCGRCVDLCPTRALALHPFNTEAAFGDILRHPLIGAVELHTRFADPYMLPAFWQSWGALLKDKLLSLCFRPDQVPAPQWREFIREVNALTAGTSLLMLQFDGRPMSGTEESHASLPALRAAAEANRAASGNLPPITISGGINAETARYLQLPEYRFIRGVGMGTVARKTVWPFLSQPEAAQRKALDLVALFHPREFRL